MADNQHLSKMSLPQAGPGVVGQPRFRPTEAGDDYRRPVPLVGEAGLVPPCTAQPHHAPEGVVLPVQDST